MARSFNGSNQRGEGNSGGINVPLTMATLINPANITTTSTFFQIGVAGASDQGRFTINIHGSLSGDPVRCTTINSAGTSSFAETSSGFSANNWQHMAAVFAATNSRAVYLNGGSKGTNSTNVTVNTTTKVNVGCSHSTTGTYPGHFNGLLAFPTIWNVALTDAEVALLAKPGFNPLHMRPESIVWHAPLTGRFSPEIELYSGASLTLANAPAYADNPPLQEVLAF